MNQELEQAARELVTEFSKQTNRGGGVLITSSIREFAEFCIKSPAAKEYWEQQGWVRVQDGLPRLELRVLCYYEDSENHFICWRTNDCKTGEEKWYGGAIPTHWQYLTKPNK